MSGGNEQFRGNQNDPAGQAAQRDHGGSANAAPPSDQAQAPLDAASWQRLIDAANCASLLVAISARLGPVLRARLQPEDILQESLLQAWRDRAGAQFQTPRAFRSWLLTIIDHRIRDAAERAATLKRGGPAPATIRQPELPAALEPSGSTTPSRVAAYREQAAVMAEALQGVPPEWRDVVHLRLFHQLTLEQVSEQLGLSLAVVRTRLRRGAEVYRLRLRAGGIGQSTMEPSISSAAPRPDPASTV